MSWRRAAILVLAPLAVIAGACTSQSSGSVTGTLVEEGGPSPSNHAPVAGTVQLTSSSGTYTVTAGSDGNFTVSAPPGKYTIRGRPLRWKAGGYPCGGDMITVSAGGSVKGTSVVCGFP